MRIGFVGLGAMGRGLAGRLAAAGHEVRAWNRTPPSPGALSAGIAVVPALSDLAKSEVIVSMLAHDGAVREVFLEERLLETLARDAIHVNMATVSVELARDLAARHKARGLFYVAAPVLGRPDAAAEGRLQLLVAGPDAAMARLEGLWAVLGQCVWRFGDQPESANAAKIASNLALACAIEAMGEATLLAEAHGVAAGPYLEMLTATLFASPALKMYGTLMAEKRFQPAAFRLTLGLKDVNLALAAGAEASLPLAFASVMRDQFLDCVAHGEGDWDWLAVVNAGRRHGKRSGPAGAGP